MLQLEEERPNGLHWEVVIQLKQYMEQFLEGSYGLLMGPLRKSLEAGLGISRLGRPDFLRFIHLARLSTGYVRLKQVICPCASSTLPGCLPAMCNSNR
jgi:hypothetical protein